MDFSALANLYTVAFVTSADVHKQWVPTMYKIWEIVDQITSIILYLLVMLKEVIIVSY